MYVFVHAQGIKTVHVVVECPLRTITQYIMSVNKKKISIYEPSTVYKYYHNISGMSEAGVKGGACPPPIFWHIS